MTEPIRCSVCKQEAVILLELDGVEGRVPACKDHAFMVNNNHQVQGKIVAVLTDSLWRWQLNPGSERPYGKFWGQVIEWMSPSESSLDPGLDPERTGTVFARRTTAA